MAQQPGTFVRPRPKPDNKVGAFEVSQVKAAGSERSAKSDPIAAALDHVEATNRPMLTPAEVATLLGVSERTLERWRQTGEGPAYFRLTRKTVRYAAVEVTAFIASSRRENTAQ